MFSIFHHAFLCFPFISSSVVITVGAVVVWCVQHALLAR